MTSFTLERKVNLPTEKVWSLIGDFAATPGPDIKVEVEKEGDPKKAGAGIVRIITIGKVCVKEILDSANPPNSFTYRILSGAPMKEYIGRVNFKDEDGATLIHWQVDIKPKIPFTGPILVKISKGVVNGIIDAVEKYHT